MNKIFKIILCVFICTIFSKNGYKVYRSADETQPLQPGDSLPAITYNSIDGTEFDLINAIKSKPTILIYYRGGWCPFCTRQLSNLNKVIPDLIKMKYQIFAISPDLPNYLLETKEHHSISYQLLSDVELKGASAMGISFKMDSATILKYEKLNFQIEKHAGNSLHILPVPSVFIIDINGIIRFTFSEPNYKIRIKHSDLMNAANFHINKK